MVLSIFSFFLIIGLVLLVLFFSWFNISLFISISPCYFLMNNILEFVVLLDPVVVICLSMLLICSLLAFIYCFHYYYDSADVFSLFYLMVWFVVVMMLLVLSGSLVFTLVMWEYLGFVSFLLILFYSNSSSVRASLITLLASRFGDVGLFVIVVCSLCGVYISSFFFLSFFLVVVTKSAGFPFISWLLEAMRAPTPVSSLVHSSTLVAAGVWFIVRYGFMVNSFYMFYVFVVSLLTIIVTGVCALFFLDLKKVVALSTCNNVAWCLVYYTCGDYFLVIFQLLVHGVCKCALFILVGDLMSSSSGSQSGIGVYMSRYGGVYGFILLSLLIFCLCGFPFLGIYFSKHFFFSYLVGGVYNIFLVLFVLLAFMVSYAYSFRLVLVISSGASGLSFGYLSSFIYVFLFVLVGTFLGWFIGGVVEECIYLSFFWSLLFLLAQLCGFLLGYLVYIFSVSGWFWNTILWGSDSLVNFFYSIYDVLSGISSVVIYRWEVSVLSALVRFCGFFFSGGSMLFSLNFIILGVFFYVLFCLLGGV
uniref:NADH:ubiquinone reductase (H(+)-translocating) n=1 Tax=Cardiocephaloides medioconiger TaxID=1354361 RepID=A0A6J3YQ91_9TREM|nr:NADH dehydrogenase subunit 5 [Cardiocephaloides medioconiger]